MDQAKRAHFASPISPSRWAAFGKHFNIETSEDDMRDCVLTWQGWLSATDGEEQPWTGRPRPPPDISKRNEQYAEKYAQTIIYCITHVYHGPNLNQHQSYQSSNVRQDPRHPEPAVASLSIFSSLSVFPLIFRKVTMLKKRDGNNLPWMHHSIPLGRIEASARSLWQGWLLSQRSSQSWK